jgi:hypothetical protein
MAQSALDKAFARASARRRMTPAFPVSRKAHPMARWPFACRKFLACMKDADTLVIHCPMEEKEMLKEAAPEIYWETDHYKGWPVIPIRLAAISDAELRHRLEKAWRMRAGKRLIAAYDQSR